MDVNEILKGVAILRRFQSKIKYDGTCWLWTGSKMHKGYGQFSPTSTQNIRAHKFSYLAYRGKIEDGLHLDHLCRRRECVNPYHLEPVSPRENLRRSPIAPAQINSLKTHCPSGHEYSGANLKIRANGSRDCLLCARAESERYRNSNRILINARRKARRANGKAN